MIRFTIPHCLIFSATTKHKRRAIDTLELLDSRVDDARLEILSVETLTSFRRAFEPKVLQHSTRKSTRPRNPPLRFSFSPTSYKPPPLTQHKRQRNKDQNKKKIKKHKHNPNKHAQPTPEMKETLLPHVEKRKKVIGSMEEVLAPAQQPSSSLGQQLLHSLRIEDLNSLLDHLAPLAAALSDHHCHDDTHAHHK